MIIFEAATLQTVDAGGVGISNSKVCVVSIML